MTATARIRVKRTEYILPAGTMLAWAAGVAAAALSVAQLEALAAAAATTLTVAWVVRRWVLPLIRAFELGYLAGLEDAIELRRQQADPHWQWGEFSTSVDD